jgi:cyclin B
MHTSQDVSNRVDAGASNLGKGKLQKRAAHRVQAVPLLHQTRRLKTGVAKSSGVVVKSSGVDAKGSGVVVKRAAACVFPPQPKLHDSAISSQTTAAGVVHDTDARDKGESSGYQYSRDPDDIDERDANNELMVTAYVKDMFQFFREQEHRAVISPYLGGDDAIQSIINERMRSILVDWLVEIHIGMKCDPATLYLSVQIIDRFLASESPSNKATKKNLQLIGTSAFFIASKYEQIYPVSLRDLVYVCDHVYSEDDVSFLLLFTLILLSTKKLPLTSFFFCIILFCRSFRWKQLFSRL